MRIYSSVQFRRRVDDLETLAEKKARVTGKVEGLRFSIDQQEVRWSRFKNEEPAVMFATDGEKVVVAGSPNRARAWCGGRPSNG
jgi:tRNA G37 N-methylase Trm5